MLFPAPNYPTIIIPAHFDVGPDTHVSLYGQTVEIMTGLSPTQEEAASSGDPQKILECIKLFWHESN